ncbi:MAG: hypothetical protein HYT42_00430 [Candidatus Sungbacteria bacterium]|nr:hypothetical protein [Candidatus Sungbacteria bacterium]
MEGKEEEVTGENPTLGGDMRTMVEFDAAITCIHGHTIAPTCALCHRPNWLDCPVRSSEPGVRRTVGDVVREFLEAKKIDSVRVVRRHVRTKQRQARAAARGKTKTPKSAKGRSYKKWAVIAGLTAVSGVLLYETGKLVLKLFTERRDENPR